MMEVKKILPTISRVLRVRPSNTSFRPFAASRRDGSTTSRCVPSDSSPASSSSTRTSCGRNSVRSASSTNPASPKSPATFLNDPRRTRSQSLTASIDGPRPLRAARNRRDRAERGPAADSDERQVRHQRRPAPPRRHRGGTAREPRPGRRNHRGRVLPRCRAQALPADVRRSQSLRGTADDLAQHSLRSRGRGRADHQGTPAKGAGLHRSDRKPAQHDQQSLDQVLHAERHLSCDADPAGGPCERTAGDTAGAGGCLLERGGQAHRRLGAGQGAKGQCRRPASRLHPRP